MDELTTQTPNQTADYAGFLTDILSKIKAARYEMLSSVSKQTVLLYWQIGAAVSTKMEASGWGAKTVGQLSKDIQSEFPGVRGFSVRNIWRMKALYEFYAQFGTPATLAAQFGNKLVLSQDAPTATTAQNCATAVAQLSSPNSATAVAELQSHIFQLVTGIGWVHNCIIIEKCKTIEQVVFYLLQTKDKGWSKFDLLDKIEKNYFENHALAQNNFEKTVPASLKAQVAWEFLDDYNVELINPDQPISEKTLENAIVGNMVNFLREMGGTFAFVGRQFPLMIGEKESFVDLLFFNMTLNCYIVFELKAREFSAKDIGQTQLYMQLINKQVKQPYHNPTIGIIICRKKDRVEVEYMLEITNAPMGVATFNQYDKLPEEYAKYLPSETEIAKRLTTLLTTEGNFN